MRASDWDSPDGVGSTGSWRSPGGGQWAGRVALAVITVVSGPLLTGCSGESRDAGPPSPVSSASTETRSGLQVRVVSTVFPGDPTTQEPQDGEQLELPAVLEAPAGTDPLEPGTPPELMEAFDAANCPDELPPTVAPPAVFLLTCDTSGLKYLLGPAVIVGGVERAEGEPAVGGTGWRVSIDFDDEATQSLADVTSSLAGTSQQLALVMDGRVLSAPSVMAAITVGKVQISGNFTEAEATSLAGQLLGKIGTS